MNAGIIPTSPQMPFSRTEAACQKGHVMCKKGQRCSCAPSPPPHINRGPHKSEYRALTARKQPSCKNRSTLKNHTNSSKEERANTQKLRYYVRFFKGVYSLCLLFKKPSNTGSILKFLAAARLVGPRYSLLHCDSEARMSA